MDEEDGKDPSVRKRRKVDFETDHEEKFVVGIVATTITLTGEVKRVDGAFGKPHDVGRYVEKKYGKVKAVRITRSGVVIIDCNDAKQMEKVLDQYFFGEGKDKVPIKTFRMGEGARTKGVISRVQEDIRPCKFEDGVKGVCHAKRLTRYREGKREDTGSMCLTFEGEMPGEIVLDYVTYRVRPYESAPLRCFCCQEYGHVASVCRRVRRCGRCGGEGCKEECGTEDPKCLHCEGSHVVGSAECPKRKEEVKVSRIRMEKVLTYAEAVKRKDEKRGVMKETEDKKKKDEGMWMDKGQFLAFIAMVMSCDKEQDKEARIKMILDAARTFLNIADISGEDLESKMNEGFAKTQTNMG